MGGEIWGTGSRWRCFGAESKGRVVGSHPSVSASVCGIGLSYVAFHPALLWGTRVYVLTCISGHPSEASGRSFPMGSPSAVGSNPSGLFRPQAGAGLPCQQLYVSQLSRSQWESPAQTQTAGPATWLYLDVRQSVASQSV